jgi:hypothetical protein
MSAVMEQVTDVVDITPKNTASNLVVMTPGQLVGQLMQQGGSMDLLAMERLMGLQERWDANEAKKAYHAAMAAFKQNPPTILKDKHVEFTTSKGTTAYDHATIGNVVKQIVASLAEHDLSHSWSTEQLDGGQVAVTCTITHKAGHSESVTLKAGRDESGGKNSIQALGSAITYLQRYTLLAITGLAVEDGSDDDGRGADGSTMDASTRLELWTLRARAAKTLDELKAVRAAVGTAFSDAKDIDGWNSFKAVYIDCRAVLEGGSK